MKTVNLEKVCEHIDYQMIPVDESNNEQAWQIRILRGQFTESIIRYGNVSFDGTRDCLTFNFTVIYSPDEELTSENVELQEFAADILEDILETAHAEGWLITEDRNGNQS